MEYIFFVAKENASKVEAALKNDDIVARQSIAIRDATALGIEAKGSFMLVSGSDDAIEKAKELVKEFVAESEFLDKAREAIAKEEDSAASGMGAIFG
jgi:hypothetical protein